MMGSQMGLAVNSSSNRVMASAQAFLGADRGRTLPSHMACLPCKAYTRASGS